MEGPSPRSPRRRIAFTPEAMRWRGDKGPIPRLLSPSGAFTRTDLPTVSGQEPYLIRKTLGPSEFSHTNLGSIFNNLCPTQTSLVCPSRQLSLCLYYLYRLSIKLRQETLFIRRLIKNDENCPQLIFFPTGKHSTHNKLLSPTINHFSCKLPPL